MNPIRIHLGPMPAMLRTIVSDLLTREPDMVVVGRSDLNQDALQEAGHQRAEVLITQDGTGPAATCVEAVVRGSGRGIFALSADGRNGVAVSLVRQPISLSDNKQCALADAVRRMVKDLDVEPDDRGGCRPGNRL